MRLGDSAALSVKHHLSRQHFWAARYFATESERIENLGMQGISEDDRKRHQAYVVGAIISAIAALEASINEFYQEAVDKSRNTLPGLTDRQFELLAELWTQIERRPILHKYQVALLAAEADIFDKGAPPYQDVYNLVKLREALVHYKPQWDDEKGHHTNLESRLRDKFPLNALSQPRSLWFPQRCLGFGCANWGLNTVSEFISEFCKRIHIPNRL